MIAITELKRRMRRLRERHALSQQAFAQVAGLDYKFYQYLESPRKKQVWLETVDRVASTYGMELWQLLHPQYLRYSKHPQPSRKKARS